MKPPNTPSLFDQLSNCDFPIGTDFSSIFPSSTFSTSSTSSTFSTLSTFSASSEPLVLTPWKLKEWKPSKPVSDLNDDHKACPLGWKTVQLSPLVSVFLPAEFDPGNFDPTMLEFTEQTIDSDGTGEKDETETTEKTETTDDTDNTQALEIQNLSFDMTTLTSFFNQTNLSKPHSRVHSGFLTSFQSIMGEQNLDSDSNLDSKFMAFQKSKLVSNSTMSAMNILCGSTSSRRRATNHHVVSMPWRSSKCRTRLRAPPKSHSKSGLLKNPTLDSENLKRPTLVSGTL